MPDFYRVIPYETPSWGATPRVLFESASRGEAQDWALRWQGPVARTERYVFGALPADVLAALSLALPRPAIEALVDAATDGVPANYWLRQSCSEMKAALASVSWGPGRDNRPAGVRSEGGHLQCEWVWNLAADLIGDAFAAIADPCASRWERLVRACATLCDARQVLDELGVRPQSSSDDALAELERVGLLAPLLTSVKLDAIMRPRPHPRPLGPGA